MPSTQSPAVPVHVGVIMDGNGRWARNRSKPRTFGHSEGLKSAKEIVRFAAELGIKYLTLYTFSTENWKRTEEEVGFLMSLISKHLKNEMNFYRENKVRVRMCGDPSPLPDNLIKEIRDVEEDTAAFDGLTVILAINYGGRDEIIRAARAAAAAGKELTEETIASHLDNPEVPDPDLIIRTAGEQRLSNFLLWQSAYSEYYFTETLWPDFGRPEFSRALEAFNKRTRKFGGVL